MTPYNLLRLSCGLSQREAADLHDVREQTVKDWCSRRPAPEGVIDDLLDLMATLDKAASAAAKAIHLNLLDRHDPEEIEIGLASDDHEAQSLGLPCVGAHAAMIRRVIERLPVHLARRVVIVPRGSTLGSAAAIEARER